MAEKKRSFEEAMARLEEIVGLLEQGETPLEQSLALFEEGTKLMKQCETLLNRAEQKVTKLVSPTDGTQVPFEPEEP